MSKLAVITGATGTQGEGAVRAFLEAGWKVRALTRNPSGEKGQALKGRGVEVVEGDLNDVEGLTKAFEGAHAIFGLTNFWEGLFTLGTQEAAGQAEQKQAWNLAVAASKTLSTLEHYFWSTLPWASAQTNGKFPCPHFDYKAEIDDRIEKELPQLARKTTFVWLGFYASNLVSFPIARPLEVPGTGSYIWIAATPASSLIPVVGDVPHNISVFIAAAIANPDKVRGKYLNVRTEVCSFGEILAAWSNATGKNAIYLPTAPEKIIGLYGVAGQEMVSQLLYGEAVQDWEGAKKARFVQPEEIGIKKEQLLDMKATFNSLKSQLI